MTRILTRTGWRSIINEERDIRDTPQYKAANAEVGDIIHRHVKAGTYPSPKMMGELSAAQKKHGKHHFHAAALNHMLDDHSDHYDRDIPHSRTGEQHGSLYNPETKKLATLKKIYVAHEG